MSKGKIVFYDDDQTLVNQFDELMSESGFEIIKYSDFNTLRKEIAEPNNLMDTKALVFDLARSKEEEGLSKNFEILKDINEKFENQYRIPIFIHSAFANEIDDFRNCGTVWKIEKSGTSLVNIVEIITKT